MAKALIYKAVVGLHSRQDCFAHTLSACLTAGDGPDQTAKELVLEAESQLDKQQKAEHGGVIRGSDAAKVQVSHTSLFFLLRGPARLQCCKLYPHSIMRLIA